MIVGESFFAHEFSLLVLEVGDERNNNLSSPKSNINLILDDLLVNTAIELGRG
jgi:hypothetical protein